MEESTRVISWAVSSVSKTCEFVGSSHKAHQHQFFCQIPWGIFSAVKPKFDIFAGFSHGMRYIYIHYSSSILLLEFTMVVFTSSSLNAFFKFLYCNGLWALFQGIFKTKNMFFSMYKYKKILMLYCNGYTMLWTQVIVTSMVPSTMIISKHRPHHKLQYSQNTQANTQQR